MHNEGMDIFEWAIYWLVFWVLMVGLILFSIGGGIFLVLAWGWQKCFDGEEEVWVHSSD